MNHYAIITNTYTVDTPEYKWAQMILRYEANRMSRLRRLNREISDSGMVPVPKYVPRKKPFHLSLISLLP